MANYSRRTTTPGDIAVMRSNLIDNVADRETYLRTFTRVRKVAPALAATPFDLETVCGLAMQSSVMEAAMIEALASLRAEGVRL